MNPVRTVIVAALLLCGGAASGAQRVVLEGRLEVAGLPYSDEGADYVMRADALGRVLVGVSDGAGRVVTVLPARVELVGEVQDGRLTGDLPLVNLVGLGGGSRIFPSSSGFTSGMDAARFAGSDNGLYPSLEEPVSRRLSGVGGGGTEPSDRDGDGVPDSQDAFPDDPNEWVDTDGDGTGNNADADDDDDGMRDTYEVANGLNPLVNDADGDLDGDGIANIEEQRIGTSPRDAGSVFRPVGVEFGARGEVSVRWSSVKGVRYRVLWSKAFDGNYGVVASGVLGEAGSDTTTALLEGMKIERTGFFKVEVE